MSTPERRSPLHPQVTRRVPTTSAPPNPAMPAQRVVPILNAGACIVASIPAAATDSMLLRLRDEVLARLESRGGRGVVIDVEAVDVLDSFAVHVLNSLAQMAALQQANVVVTGLRADLAAATARLGAPLEDLATYPTVTAGLASLAEGPERCARAGA